jgi:hypothetical protein
VDTEKAMGGFTATTRVRVVGKALGCREREEGATDIVTCVYMLGADDDGVTATGVP